MSLLTIVFIVGAIAVFAWIFFGMLDERVMPFSCPRCHAGSDETIAGTSVPWYREHRGGVECRSCYTRFREHPNGSLVEDA